MKKGRNYFVRTSVHAYLEETVKTLLNDCNCKIKLIAITGGPMKNADQVDCCYLKGKMYSLII